MKTVLWFARNEDPVIQITLSLEAAEWLLSLLPKDDGARRELSRVIEEVEASRG